MQMLAWGAIAVASRMLFPLGLVAVASGSGAASDSSGASSGSAAPILVQRHADLKEANNDLLSHVREWIQNKDAALAKHGQIGLWDTSKVTSMAFLFQDEAAFNDNLSAWDLARVENTTKMFSGALQFTSDLSAWDVSQVAAASHMFDGATEFTSDLSSWDVSQVEDASYFVYRAVNFTSNLALWDVSSFQNVNHMLAELPTFTSNLSTWDVARVNNMEAMLARSFEFVSDLSTWDVSGVHKLGGMFRQYIGEKSPFNSDLSAWDVSAADDFSHMFEGAVNFTSDLSTWDVSGATRSTSMFFGASKFTSDLAAWDLSQNVNMSCMFYGASSFSTDFSTWQVPLGSDIVSMFTGSQVLDNFTSMLPCWYIGATCPPLISYPRGPNARKAVKHSFVAMTVDPTEMSATMTYRVGTVYRIEPLDIEVVGNSTFMYSLIDAPNGFYVNPTTGSTIATFDNNDVTVGHSTNGRLFEAPLKVTLQMIADEDNFRVEIETYIMHVEVRNEFKLVFGNRWRNELFLSQYLVVEPDVATVVMVDTPFRIACRHIDPTRSLISGGRFEDITYAFRVLDTKTGEPRGDDLDRIAIKSHGEILGQFSRNEIGTFTIIITAIDGIGGLFYAETILLDVRQLDVRFAAFGPNNKGCSNNGVPVDDSGDLFDGKFTSCDCTAVARYVGENCETFCGGPKDKDPDTGECAEDKDYFSGMARSQILGVTFGNIGFFLLLAVGVVQYRRYCQRRSILLPIHFDDFNQKMLKSGNIEESQLCNDRKPRELKRSNVVLLREIGGGAFGTVWMAMLDESSTTGRPAYQVAVKTVADAGTAAAAATDDLMTEATVMAQVEGHRNLVSIIGVVTVGDPVMLILTYCDHSSMLSYLKTRAAEDRTVPSVHKIDFAAQTARGMEHLSERHFIHRDLATRNVLMTSGKSISNLVCKVADFGLSRAGSRSARGGSRRSSEGYYYKSREGGAFPVRWTAPEAMERLKFTQASDVWSFGIVLIEIIQDGTRPFPTIKSNQGVVRYSLSGEIHPIPLECKANPPMQGLYDMACKCFAQPESARPDFSALAVSIEVGFKTVVEDDSSVPTRAETGMSAVLHQYEYSRSVRQGLVNTRCPHPSPNEVASNSVDQTACSHADVTRRKSLPAESCALDSQAISTPASLERFVSSTTTTAAFLDQAARRQSTTISRQTPIRDSASTDTLDFDNVSQPERTFASSTAGSLAQGVRKQSRIAGDTSFLAATKAHDGAKESTTVLLQVAHQYFHV
jgi:surface protein